MANTIGGSLQKARRRSGLLQRQLAERVGISPSAVSRFEDDDKVPSAETFGKLVAAIFEERIGEGAKVLGFDLVGHTKGGRMRYEVVTESEGKSITIPLEGKRPLGERKSGNRLWPARSKERHLEMLGDLLDVSLDGPPLVVYQIARSIGARGV